VSCLALTYERKLTSVGAGPSDLRRSFNCLVLDPQTSSKPLALILNSICLLDTTCKTTFLTPCFGPPREYEWLELDVADIEPVKAH
jgi:hypothetical protein